VDSRPGSSVAMPRFVSDDPSLTGFALETTAYSELSEWPGRGLFGIHGASNPWLLGRAISHGCIRNPNAAALVLKRSAPHRTVVDLVA
jgi:lipoprotein-anchoring transpeptidase ErfK/SrfK